MSEQPIVLPWHREAAHKLHGHIYTVGHADRDDLSAIIARHDPAPLSLVEKKVAYLQAQHAETLRLLERAHEWLDDYGMRMSGCAGLSDEIRAHLAAHRQTAQAVGGGK